MDQYYQIICTICQDAVTRQGQNDDIIATQCGHVFHKACLSDWFQTKEPVMAHPVLPADELIKGTCPVCSTPQWLKRCLKIYHSLDEEGVNFLNHRLQLLEQDLAEAMRRISNAEETIEIQEKIIANLRATNVKLSTIKSGDASSRAATVKVPKASATLPPPKPKKVQNISSPAATTRPRTPKRAICSERPAESSHSMTLRGTTVRQRLAAGIETQSRNCNRPGTSGRTSSAHTRS